MPEAQLEACSETDQLMAALLGWKWDDRSAFRPGGGRYSRMRNDPWWWLPSYSGNMSDAWELVDHLKPPRCVHGVVLGSARASGAI